MRTYAKIERETYKGSGWFRVRTKRADELNRWPGHNMVRYDTKAAAEKAAELAGHIIVKRWYDAAVMEEELTRTPPSAGQSE